MRVGDILQNTYKCMLGVLSSGHQVNIVFLRQAFLLSSACIMYILSTSMSISLSCFISMSISSTLVIRMASEDEVDSVKKIYSQIKIKKVDAFLTTPLPTIFKLINIIVKGIEQQTKKKQSSHKIWQTKFLLFVILYIVILVYLYIIL